MAERTKQVKCVVWDLDNTLWEGTLSEGGGRSLRPGLRESVLELDRRGIVQSIASKNDPPAALRRLRELGLEEYFLCPQISWNPKPLGLRAVLDALNIKPEAAAFVDDQPAERDEMRASEPLVRVYGAEQAASLPEMPEFQVRFVTEDASRRRLMYRADLARQGAEREFSGSDEQFLATLGMRLAIAPVTEDTLRRVEELTVRTHQLNSTGYTFSYEELSALTASPSHIFRICSLTDRYGDSGHVGLLLMESGAEALTIRLLIVSCRVMTRGVGTALLAHATRLAAELGKALRAEFLETEYNRIMYITYRLAGFEELEEDGKRLLLEYRRPEPLPYPDYLAVDEPVTV
ncbi:MAG: HAD-IIIC family phosphatase [Oscillospiraceae bacterium]|nr:HAD-IIIC family phosphatase [Oscillospiraceae bacterium]